jgi:hypothetical protein
MAFPEVVVVAEVPSLGSSVFELLIAGGLDAITVADMGELFLRYTESGGPPPRVLVCAAANRRCQSAGRWAGGPFAEIPLIVVGTRDPNLPEADHIHFVTLPLSPPVLLEMVRRFVGQVRGTASGAS